MAMTAGTVSVSRWAGADDDPPSTGSEEVTGSGAALAVYNALVATASYQVAAWPVVGQTYGSTEEDLYGNSPEEITQEEYNNLVPIIADSRYNLLTAAANLANAIGATLVTYMQANAELQVQTDDDGLQKTPNPNNADTPTVAPAAPVTFGKVL